MLNSLVDLAALLGTFKYEMLISVKKSIADFVA